MNPSLAIGNTTSGIHAGDGVLWAADSIDATGNLVEILSYDACKVKLGFCEQSETKALVESISLQLMQREGRRRKANNWTDYNVITTLFDRGYTGHACPEQSRREHLDQFGLINMNGRVYDPFLARFLSPDPFVQAPSYSQNYNRYSYAWNNSRLARICNH